MPTIDRRQFLKLAAALGATLASGCVTVVSPEGQVLRQVMFPDPMVTNICFGGPDMRTAYITLSDKGQLASTTWPEPGLKLNFNP